MKTRISVTLDPAIGRKAKKLAVKRGTTVSGLIELLLLHETKSTRSSSIDAMIGSAQLRKPAMDSDPRFDHLQQKYLHE